jgi:Icc-related predicted phosphoesterase
MGLFNRRQSSAAANGSATRIFFCSDVHGSTVCFKKFVNAASFYGADTLILGGDVTGKMVVPIARQTDGRYITSFSGQDVEFTSEGEVADFTKRMANMGFYPKVMDEEAFRDAKASPDAQEQLFRELVAERLQEWIAFAEDKLAGSDIAVYAAPGNDDFFEVDEILASSDRIKHIELQVLPINDKYSILTSGWTNPTPWNTERECSEEELSERLQGMIDQVHDMDYCIFNLHVPPHDSKIDLCPKLDDEMRVVYDLGNPVMAPAGSTAVRAAIERHQPLLSLHGHIHEGRGEARIGRTVCLNPGSVYSEGVLNGILITLDGAQVRDYQFTQG